MASALASVSASSNSSSAITTKKVSPSYWRATFSNPPFNVQTNAWFTDLYKLIDDIENDPDVQVVVFDSNVPDFWVAHLDVVGPIDQSVIETYFGNITRLANLPVVTVAAIRGIARGGGAEFAAALDVRFASKEKAVFAQFEVGTGGIPGGGGLSFLPRLVGRGRTMEIVLGADDLDADTAALYGWINRAIPDCDFESFVDKFAHRVAGWDYAAISTAKEIINNRTGYPKSEEQQSDFATFGQLASQPTVAKRYGALAAAGFESKETFEINLTSELLKFTGEGPWTA